MLARVVPTRRALRIEPTEALAADGRLRSGTHPLAIEALMPPSHRAAPSPEPLP